MSCNPVRDYDQPAKKMARVEEDVSEDELEIAAHVAVDGHFGAKA